ncbi:MAG: hypothetical protein M1826_004840 [Phylliscum demangeonii]|nr:MAG: hypothetical protein M1826_004840 [Phylliscum demangeonii]
MKHPKGPGKEYMTAPLLVMNNLMSRAEPGSDDGQTSVPKHLESLLSSAFQSLFPPIAPQTTPLSSIRRVLLVDRELHTTNPESGNGGYVVDLRHYAIGTKLTGLSKAVRRLKAAEQLVRAQERKKKRLPNLGRLDDLADYILDPSAATGYASTSESEVETDAEVEVLERPVRKVLSTKKHESQRARDDGESQSGRGAVEKRAVKLEELGPRMKLRLVKIEENVCSGKVLWHDFISKTKEEERKMETVWEERRREKEARIKQQRENIARKQKAQGQGEEAAEGVADDEVDGDAMAYEWDSEDVEEDGDMDVDEENAADSRK